MAVGGNETSFGRQTAGDGERWLRKSLGEVIEAMARTGAQAELFVVRHRKEDTKHVTKVYRHVLKAKSEVLDRIQQQQCPDLVQIDEHGESGDRCYEVMEHGEAGTLRGQLAQGALSLTQTRTW